MIFDLGLAVRCAAYFSAVDRMYGATGLDLAPAPDPALTRDFCVRANITMCDGFGTRRFYGVLAQSISDSDEFFFILHGTRSAGDVFANLDARLTRFSAAPAAGRVARGWHAMYQSALVTPSGSTVPREGDLPDTIASFMTSPAPKLTVTSHSLGAALCTLFVAHCNALKCIAVSRFYTFASPRVGDAAFSATWNALPIEAARFANTSDIVPLWPPNVLGYRHIARAIQLTSGSRFRLALKHEHSMAAYRRELATASHR